MRFIFAVLYAPASLAGGVYLCIIQSVNLTKRDILTQKQ